MRRVSLFAFLAAALFSRIAVAQTTITVGQGGGYDYSAIQAGIDAATTGDTVVVYPGIYYENIRFRGRDIILRSTNPTDTATVAATIIDGRSSGSVVTFIGTETSSCILSGFAIENGHGANGAGIRGNGARAAIQNNRVISNSAPISGGGGLYGCDGTIQNNTIWGNRTAGYGGGLYWCNGTIENNTIRGNTATLSGGGLETCNGTIQNNAIWGNSALSGGGLRQCQGTIQNNTIWGNLARSGGGLHQCQGTIQNNTIWGNSGGAGGGGLSRCYGTIQNNTIWGNSADSGGGLYDCQGTVVNCIVWANTARQFTQIGQSSTPTYSCIEDWTGGGVGNISLDPRLLDPADGDFRLSGYSPCIDAGGSVPLQTDFEGDVRPFDGVGQARGDGSDIDIGADECTAVMQSEPPDTPINLSPQDGATGVGIQPTLVASPFVDPDVGDVHQLSHWQIRRADSPSDYSQLVFDSGPSTTDLTSVTVGPLHLSTDYFWRVRYGDYAAIWSEWSDETGFRTRDPGTLTVGKGVGYDFSAIQAAIDAATTYDSILVYPGIYTENIHLRGKGIAVTSTRPTDAATVASTVIDGNQSGWVVKFAGTEISGTVLAGFTICNGGGYDPIYGTGGGILGNGTRATVENNTITSNSGSGIVYCDGAIVGNTVRGNRGANGAGLGNCNGTIRGNAIYDNHASFGGGLSCCDGTIRENAIYGNSADHGGGGLWHCNGVIESNVICENWGGGLGLCGGTIQNNLIVGNGTWSTGAGLFNCSGAIRNNTILDNQAGTHGGGIYGGGAVTNCILWGNRASVGHSQIDSFTTPTYCYIQDWAGGGEGSISAEPSFVDADGPDDDPQTWEDNDYRLKYGSPCIDAGNPAAEYNDGSRPPGLRTERNDMGAYGGPYNGGWPTPPAVDLIGSLSNVGPSPIGTSQQVTLSGMVINQGDQPPTSPAWVEFWAINLGTGWTGFLCDSVWLEPLAAGQSLDLASVTPPRTVHDTIPAGAYAVEMRIDATNAVAEWQETNNVTRWQGLTIFVDRPNLAVSGFNFSPQDASPDGGTTLTFWGIVRNTGSQPTTGPFTIEFRLWPAPGFEPTGPQLCDSYVIEQTLALGEGVNLATLPPRVTYALSPGIYTVGIIVDAAGQVTEQREDDNIASLPQKPLYVGLRPLGAARWPLYR